MSADGRDKPSGPFKSLQSSPRVTDPRAGFKSAEPSGQFLGVEAISSGASRDWGHEEEEFKRTESGNYRIEQFERTASGSYVIPQFERTKSGRYRTPTAAGANVVRVGKILASILDALVRSIRSRGRNTLDIAQRAIEVWFDEPELVLSTTPNAIAVGSQVAYESEKGEGEWILPLFMAGVRHIGIQQTTGPADLCRFAEQLGLLTPTPESVDQFRDWIWADGAAGLVLDVRMSYLEAFEALDLAPPPVIPELIAGTVELRTTSGVPELVSSDERDALEHSFHAPIVAFEEAARTGQLAGDDRERIALRAASADGEMWALAELETAITDVRLAKAVAPERIANALWARISTQVDVPLLRILVELVGARDEHSRTIVSALERVPLGATIARTVVVATPVALAGLHRVLADASPRVSAELMHGLLARAEGDVGAFDGLVKLGHAAGLREFLAWVDPGKLTPALAGTLGYVMTESFGDSVDVSSLLPRIPGPAAVALLGVLSPATLLRMKSHLKRLLRNALGNDLVRLLETLVKTEARECVRIIGEEIEETGAAQWSAVATRGSLRALIAYGFGADYVLPLVRSRKAPVEVRLAALDAMAAEPELLAEAARWRPGGMLDDPEIRRRLKALRKEEE